MEQLVGTGVALVTPFKEDFSIDTAVTTLRPLLKKCRKLI